MPFTQADLDWAAQTFRDAEADREARGAGPRGRVVRPVQRQPPRPRRRPLPELRPGGRRPRHARAVPRVRGAGRRRHDRLSELGCRTRQPRLLRINPGAATFSRMTVEGVPYRRFSHGWGWDPMIGKRWGQTAPPTFPNRLYFPTPTTKRWAGEGRSALLLGVIKEPVAQVRGAREAHGHLVHRLLIGERA